MIERHKIIWDRIHKMFGEKQTHISHYTGDGMSAWTIGDMFPIKGEGERNIKMHTGDGGIVMYLDIFDKTTAKFLSKKVKRPKKFKIPDEYKNFDINELKKNIEEMFYGKK